MKRKLLKILLTVYAALPFLCMSVIIRISNDVPILNFTDLPAVVFQAVMIPVILSIRKRRNAFGTFGLYIIMTIAGSVFLSEYILPGYIEMLLKYFPGPALTIAYVLIYRFSRFREMETMERSIRFFLLLLVSYTLMLLLISAHHAVLNKTGSYLLKDITEILNYIPAMLLLHTLSVSCRKELTVTEEKVIYHNADHTSLFNPLQLAMLRHLCTNQVIRCRDFAEAEAGCPESEFCKATKCPEYSRIYRNVQELSRKLVNLGLGEIVPPENKRDVVSSGWKLSLFEGISIKSRQKAPGITELKANTAIHHPRKDGKAGAAKISVFLMILPCAAFLSGDIIQLSSSDLNLFPVLFLVETVLFGIPFLLNIKNRFKTGLAVFTGILVLLFFISLFYLQEYSSFILLNKHWSFILILLLLNLRSWEDKIHLKDFRSNASVILFWSVWFLMVTTEIYDSPAETLPVFFKIADRLVLFTFMVLSVLFYSLPRKKLEVREGKLHLNDAALPAGLSDINMRLLLEFIENYDKNMSCLELLKLAEPENTESMPKDCRTTCKASACKPYKRIYKRIQAIKRYLESNGIGTVKNNDREQLEAEPGWSLQLHEDVFISRFSTNSR